MNLSLQDLQSEAAATGFPIQTLDKVIRLIELLNAFRSHPFLKDRMVLKGGMALNLFVFDLPRLSVWYSHCVFHCGQSRYGIPTPWDHSGHGTYPSSISMNLWQVNLAHFLLGMPAVTFLMRMRYLDVMTWNETESQT